MCPDAYILIDFSLTVKAATLIFISGRSLGVVRLFHLLRKGNQDIFKFGKELIRRRVRCWC